ncbi:PadR family transcriptional regulator [Pedobacter sp. SAFR-022]|uniref:PadR family transcriptional regulator n=1 Tax=Pedobacter sp. SAFR-022 TaxID=3436861 RepID=UPI003F819096
MSINSDLFKGTLSTILLNLLEQHGKMYGYEITQKVKAVTSGGFNLKEGALYPTLHKLEAEGLLETSSEMVDGRMRKYYELSSDGQKLAAHKLEEAREFIESLQLLLNLKPAL